MFSPVSAHIGAKRPVKEGPQSGPLPTQSQKELL
jgi:hypothetical protein